MNRDIYTNPLKTLLTLFWLLIISTTSFATNTQQWKQSDESNVNTINHQQWQTILDEYLISNHPSKVNLFRYSQVAKKDKQRLKQYISNLQVIDPRHYKKTEQMAYWINLYNALTVDLILDDYPVKSIKKLGKGLFSFGPWDDDVAVIAGQNLSLNDIEHKILRPIWQDPRIHYAVNCASYSCPNLATKVFTSANIDALLNQSARDYINHTRGVSLKNGTLIVSSIYHWYREDFGDSDAMLIKHLNQYTEPGLKQQLNQYDGAIDHSYDWQLNEPSKKH